MKRVITAILIFLLSASCSSCGNTAEVTSGMPNGTEPPAVLQAYEIPAEPPEIKITSGETEIDYAVGKNMWNGAVYNRTGTFQMASYGKSLSDYPYIELGEEITIEFDGPVPEAYTLNDYILDSDGGVKYSNEVTRELPIEFTDSTGTFVLDFNPASALSSNSEDYGPGSSVRGFLLICAWGDNECEYGFIIRSDA